MLRTLPITIALILVVAAGIFHGRRSQRWETSRAIEDAVARVGRLPMNLGDWQGKAFELDRAQLALGEIDGYIARRYEDRLHGDAVTILLVCGAPGPISVHTPDICYAGAGYEAIGTPSLYSQSIETLDAPAQFRKAVMTKSSAVGQSNLRILWTWSATGAWEAPDNPRLSFASSPVLYKLYVIREVTSRDEPIEADPTPKFLQTLLPELKRILYGQNQAETSVKKPQVRPPSTSTSSFKTMAYAKPQPNLQT